MKYIIFDILLYFVSTFIGCNLYPQYVYYGYPKTTASLNKGDIVVLNIPKHINCRFNNLNEFDDLVDIINNNEKNKLRIEINYFYGDSVMSNNCSEILFKHFKEILILKTNLNNYQVINNGCNYPSFLIKTQGDIIFKLYNSRLEIFVE